MKRIKRKQGQKSAQPLRSVVAHSRFKVAAITTAIVLSLGLAIPSIAETNETGGLNGAGNLGSSVSIETQTQAVLKEAQDCADPTNVNGMAHAQADSIEDMKKMIMTPINTDNLFSTTSKGGCFNALSDFPNLSLSIPSLTSIANALKKTLINYATRKVCTAVNDALTELIEPLNETLDKLGKNGQIDLTGALNAELSKQLYQIDPELGRVSKPINSEYNWSVSDLTGDVTDGGSTYVDGSTGSSSSTGSSGSSNTGSSGSSSGSNSGSNSGGASSGSTTAQTFKNVIDMIF